MAEPGSVSTHVLDTAHGHPAEGMRIDLYRLSGGEPKLLAHFTTNADGRTNRPVVPVGELERGFYELVFHVGAYFSDRGLHKGGLHADGPPFLDQVPVRFGIDDVDAGYHVPLLVSPYGYSTYRGS